MAIELHKKYENVTAAQITLAVGNGANSLSVNDSDVQAVLSGMQNPISQRLAQYESKEAAISKISAWLIGIVTTYCGKSESTTDLVFSQCAKYLIEKYGYLGISEVEKAFLMAAEKNPESLKTYGAFTMVQFISIIKEYAVFRGRVKRGILELQEKTEATAEEIEQKNKEADLYFEAEFERLVKQPPQHWRDLHPYMCKRWIELGLCGTSQDMAAQAIYNEVYSTLDNIVKLELENIRLGLNGLADVYSYRDLLTYKEKYNTFINNVFCKLLCFQYLTKIK